MWPPGLLGVTAPLSWEEMFLLSAGSFRKVLARGTRLSDTKGALCLCSAALPCPGSSCTRQYCQGSGCSGCSGVRCAQADR